MRPICLAILACSLTLVVASTSPAQPAVGSTGRPHTLLPVPSSVQRAEGRLALTRESTVALTGAAASDRRLREAVAQMLVRLERRTGIEFVARGPVPDAASAALVIDVAAPGGALPALGDDESYTLTVTAQQARLSAPLLVGALRGIETVLQWLDGAGGAWGLDAVRIEDRPRFPWRGLMLDVARHWLPLDVVKRQLDGMAAVKLNVLHLHLTEDQGFRIESTRFPKLHQQGSDGLFFTQAQIREIVSYAADRGIRVVPEFDMPGHVTAWLVGHPELGSAPGPYTIERGWGIFDPALDPTREALYPFLDRFFGEMVTLFPDAYLHIGGDENNGKHWNANPAITAFMKQRGFADAHALQAYFNQRVLKILQKHGKKMVGWDEVLHPDLPKDIVIHSWRGQKSLFEAARQGYSGILSNGWYIDLMQPTAQHYLVDPLPADSGLSEAEAARVLGGEATMWSEFVDPHTVDSRVWPRLGAIAERLWSPREVRDVPDMHRRLERVSVQLEEHGLSHEAHTARMARRITGTRDTAALETLLSVVGPVKVYRRGQEFDKAYGRRPTQMTPLTRIVDAAIADPEGMRAFGSRVERLLADAPAFDRDREALRRTFDGWREASRALNRMTDQRPLLHEARSLISDLGALGEIGLDALSRLGAPAASGGEAAGWRDAALARLKQAATPRVEVEFGVIEPLQKLVEAAGR
jgi:hexosaminidase